MARYGGSFSLRCDEITSSTTSSAAAVTIRQSYSVPDASHSVSPSPPFILSEREMCAASSPVITALRSFMFSGPTKNLGIAFLRVK